MTKVKLTNLDLGGLHTVLTNLSKEKLPIKFAVARNLKTVSDALDGFVAEKTKLHEDNVMVSEEGEMILKEEVKEHLDKVQAIPYNWFEYKSDKARDKFFSELEKLSTSELELDLSCEDLTRSVKIKTETGYETLSLEEVLSDPEANINADAISVLMKFELLK